MKRRRCERSTAKRSAETTGSRHAKQALHRTRTGDPFLTMEVLYQLS